MHRQDIAQDDAESKPLAQGAHKFWIAMAKDTRWHEVVGFGAKSRKPASPKRPAWRPFEMWFWLLSEAASRPRQRILQGYTIALERGQIAVSYRYLAGEANWGIKAVRLFFEQLERHKMVSLSVTAGTQLSLNFSQLQHNSAEKGTGITVITICNYDRYQNGYTTKDKRGAQQGHSRGTGRAQDSTKNIDTQEENDLRGGIEVDTTVVRLDDRRQPLRNPFGVREDQLCRYHILASAWGVKPNDPTPRIPLERSLADGNLLSGLARYEGRPPELILLAVDSTLSAMEARRHDETSAGGHRGRSGLGPCASYFSKVLNSTVDRLLLDAAKLEAEARAEMAVQKAVLEKRLSGVESGRVNGQRRRSTWEDIGAEMGWETQGV